MTTAIIGSTGKHSPAFVELRTHTRQLESDNRHLIAANEDLVCELTRSIIRGCQAEARAVELAEQVREHEAIVQRIDDRHAETVRGLERQIADLERRLQVGVLAEHVIAETQPMSTDEIRRICAQPNRVRTLQDAAAAGLLGPVLDPGRIR